MLNPIQHAQIRAVQRHPVFGNPDRRPLKELLDNGLYNGVLALHIWA
jgi:hypothetical protein